LSRLRGLFDDPLFVRTGRSMEPSARAVEIFALLSPALDSISTAVSRAAEFDPATSTAVFRIGLSDDVEFALLPQLLKRLRAEAPGIVLVVRRVNYILMPGLLASGEISIGVSYTADLPANAKRKVLRRSLPKLLRADSVPGALSLDDFCARPHALVSFAGDLSGFIDEELEKLAPDRSRDIDLRRFVDDQAIPPIYFERGYYLTPGSSSEKGYRLLAKAMEDSGRMGIGTFVMHGKEYLVAITAENGILRAQTLRFADEIRSPADVGLPKKKKPQKAIVTKFEKLITARSAKQLSTQELKDDQTDRVLKLVKSKHSRGKDIVQTEEQSSDDGNVVDIMDVLKKSLAKS